MVRYTAIFLLVALAMQTFQQTFIVLEYRFNTVAFARDCENKARPQLKCQGKCQMMKKLREEEKKKEQAPDRKLENRSEVADPSLSFPSVAAAKSLIKTNYYPSYQESATAGLSFAIFHPPALL